MWSNEEKSSKDMIWHKLHINSNLVIMQLKHYIPGCLWHKRHNSSTDERPPKCIVFFYIWGPKLFAASNHTAKAGFHGTVQLSATCLITAIQNQEPEKLPGISADRREHAYDCHVPLLLPPMCLFLLLLGMDLDLHSDLNQHPELGSSCGFIFLFLFFDKKCNEQGALH